MESSFAPRLLDAAIAADASELAAIRRNGAVEVDSLRSQLWELAETRRPERKLLPQELDEFADGALAGDPQGYGTWVFYPWSNRLVHVLPEAEFFELRTSRNRNKINLDEQLQLARLRIGVAGLSVGQATAITLALEGIGGELRLADFDVLSLSNMNRLRASVCDIGVNKAIITARTIFEFNPYARITVFLDGITDENLDPFLSSLDLLFEECDDLKMKVRLREEARLRGIPVLMETSDRGMIDVERFDREPNRPLFHGLAGELHAEELAGLTTYEKVPIMLAIVGAETMSPRLAASLVDIEASLKTWPQLASAVALGGAANTDVARRIALGQFHASGRFHIDLEQIVSDSAGAAQIAQPTDIVNESPAHGQPDPTPVASTDTWQNSPLSLGQLREVVRWAALAPSGGNCQPWRFVYRTNSRTLECWHDEERSRSFLDVDHGAAYLAFGALAENLRLACVKSGIPLRLCAFPAAAPPALLLVGHFEGEIERTREDPLLAQWVEKRTTNRQLGQREPFPSELSNSLSDICSRAGAKLQLTTEPSALTAFGELHGDTERIRMLHPTMHADMMGELRWTPAEAEKTRDGVDVVTLELTPTDRAGMHLLKSPAVARTLRYLDSGDGLKTPSRKALAAASAAGTITVSGSAPVDYFRGGQALQRVWLWAQANGFAFQPMTAFVYMFARLGSKTPGIDQRERLALEKARVRLDALFPSNGETTVFAFRLSKAKPPTTLALRRHVDDLLEIRD